MPVIGAVALAMLAGCLHSGAGNSQPLDVAACRQESPEVFVLEGSITPRMASCVATSFGSDTKEVVLNSSGGDVASALDIAGLFEGRRLTMRVRRECNSSCANYLLPLAGRIIVEPGALIVLHGSVDPWTVSRVVLAPRDVPTTGGEQSAPAASEAADPGGHWALAARQADFAARNRIPPGWLLYREAGSNGRDIEGLSEALRRRGRSLLVEERMMRSCLTAAEIQPYQEDLRRRWLGSYRRIGLYMSRIEPSGSAVCLPAA